MTNEAHGPQTRVNLFTKMNRIHNQRRYVYAINLAKDFVDSNLRRNYTRLVLNPV